MQFLVEPVSKRNGGGSYVAYYDERDKDRVYASAVIRGGVVNERHLLRLKRGCAVPTLPFEHQLALFVRG